MLTLNKTKMGKILLTGAGGNVTKAVVRFLSEKVTSEVFLTTRDGTNSVTNERSLDFEKPETFKPALKDIKLVFLLRPPQISDVNNYFKPFIDACIAAKVQHIIFLSVQGADKVRFIPHAKIENLIRESGIAFTFIRPSYFMQNLTTTLKDDIKDKNRIFLPAGHTPFLWVDVQDIGRAIAEVIANPESHRNQAYTITGMELLNFKKVAARLTAALGRKVEYIDAGLFRFFLQKKKEATPTGYILVLIMLHYLARFQDQPQITDEFFRLTGKKPNSLENFIQENKQAWT